MKDVIGIREPLNSYVAQNAFIKYFASVFSRKQFGQYTIYSRGDLSACNYLEILSAKTYIVIVG